MTRHSPRVIALACLLGLAGSAFGQAANLNQPVLQTAPDPRTIPTFKFDRAEHNFIRARGQLSLARSLSDQRAAAAAVVARLFPAADRPARPAQPL